MRKKKRKQIAQKVYLTRKENLFGPCKHFDALSLFNPLMEMKMNWLRKKKKIQYKMNTDEKKNKQKRKQITWRVYLTWEKDEIDHCEQLDALSPINPLIEMSKRRYILMRGKRKKREFR